jgi:hypothetical protein
MALLILGMLSGTFTLVHHQAVSRIGDGRRELAADRLIESLAMRLGDEFDIAPGAYSGTSGHDLDWTIEIGGATGLDPERILQARIAVRGADIARELTILRRRPF